MPVVALVPVHTIENAPEVVAARRRGPIASASAEALTPSVAGLGSRGARGGGETGAQRNVNPRTRPRTSTGFERRATRKVSAEGLAAKGGNRIARKEVRELIALFTDKISYAGVLLGRNRIAHTSNEERVQSTQPPMFLLSIVHDCQFYLRALSDSTTRSDVLRFHGIENLLENGSGHPGTAAAL